ncbi:DUF2817 domain-containing protein [Acinetobacter radioresistens]|uniref:DUF2817 domain-containing protein n=1 Tax=Acinetobacter radioresistens TaxID=40216 RepID=UPI0012503584|nr:DUF2817 domain-containing protein [Acinetobacter radioresistens]
MAEKTLQQVISDTIQDAETLEQAVNGPAGELIKSRLGREFYTLASIPQINTMTREEISTALDPKVDKTYFDTTLSSFQNGAIKTYPTLTAANADIANIALNTKVSVLSATDGGDYYKASADATSLTKSAYDPLTHSQKYTNSILAEGYIKNYTTEALLLAAKPAVAEMRARADDTRKIYRWTRISAEGVTPVTGTWVDTGVSDLDQAIAHSNSLVNNTINLFFEHDFDASYSFVIIDSENNIIEAYDKNGKKVVPDDAKVTFDFYSSESESIVLVDKDLNIIFKNKNNSEINFKNLQLNQYQPLALKNKETYIKYDTLKIQNALTDAIYNQSVLDIVTNTAAVYAFYDQLVSAHPDHMTSSVLGEDALGNEIRQYIYTPRPLQSIESEGGDTTWDAELIKPPKIVIQSGTHAGSEQEAILSAMILLKEILDRQNEIEAAMFLSQAQIVFIPVLNPSGLNASTRNNHNNVDLNRNARQTADQIPSQLETQIGISLPVLHSDAICFFDLHNYDGNYVGAWLSTFTEQTLAELKPVAFKLNAEIKHDHPFFADVPVRLQKNAARTIARDWQQFGGAKRGILIETAAEDTAYPIFQKRQLAQYVIKTTITHFLKLELGV